MATDSIHQNQPQLPKSGYFSQASPSPLTPPEKPGQYISVQQLSPQEPPLQLPPRSLIGRWRAFVLRTWLVEFFSIFLAFVFLAGVLGICALYNRHPINLTGVGLFSTPPNAELNIMVSIMRTALLVPVASGIAQLRWSWFQRRKRLADMKYFDEASRGIVGAFRLFCKPRLWYV